MGRFLKLICSTIAIILFLLVSVAVIVFKFHPGWLPDIYGRNSTPTEVDYMYISY